MNFRHPRRAKAADNSSTVQENEHQAFKNQSIPPPPFSLASSSLSAVPAPAIAMPFQKLLGPVLKDSAMNDIPTGALEGKVVAFYFSASWYVAWILCLKAIALSSQQNSVFWSPNSISTSEMVLTFRHLLAGMMYLRRGVAAPPAAAVSICFLFLPSKA